MELSISAADMVPLEEFDLRWRWTDEKHAVLGSDELARIQPLSRAVAKAACMRSLTWNSTLEAGGPLLDSLFEPLEILPDAHEQDGHEWLAAHLPTKPVPLIVSWDFERAVLTDTFIFAKHWETFCYPSRDDVDAWPIDESWVIIYRHYEFLQYGRRQGAAKS